MKTKHLLFSLLGICLFLACEQAPKGLEPDQGEGNPVISKSVFSGYVQKGPYINGSSVMITPLDKQLNQTGNIFTTQIIDNSGSFEQKNLEFASNFIELKADGYYFDEVKGENSSGSLTLYALADITDVNSLNVNILTHLERQRIIYLIQNEDLSFSDAKKQAGREVLDIFKLSLPDDVPAESLDLTEDVLLLAVSVIVQGQLSTGDMSELLANISSDIRTDGKLDNPVLGSQLMNNVAFLDLEQVKSNIEERYSILGITVDVDINELKSCIEQFKNNCGFEPTLSITYPETGKYGLNILADGFEEAKEELFTFDKNSYSMKAVLPAGNSSLKIVIKSKSVYYICNNTKIRPYRCEQYFDEWHEICPACGGVNTLEVAGYHAWGSINIVSYDNWFVSSWDYILNKQTFTVVESGKSADLSVIFHRDCIIEYYENGAT